METRPTAWQTYTALRAVWQRICRYPRDKRPPLAARVDAAICAQEILHGDEMEACRLVRSMMLL